MDGWWTYSFTLVPLKHPAEVTMGYIHVRQLLQHAGRFEMDLREQDWSSLVDGLKEFGLCPQEAERVPIAVPESIG